jgi:hypothetical protein
MAGSRDSSDISPSNIIEPTWETLPADEQVQFEEHKEQMIQEAKAKFLDNFKVDRNNKVVRHRATDPALRPTPEIPNVSNTNELQSLRNYVDEQREHMQNIIGGMQSDYRRLALLELALPSKLIQRGSGSNADKVLLKRAIAFLISPLKGTVRGYL